VFQKLRKRCRCPPWCTVVILPTTSQSHAQ
jgi:hypothetical protein